MPAAKRTLSTEVAALARDFQRTARGFVLSPAQLRGWRDVLVGLPSSRRGEVVDELTALAAKWKRLGAEKTAPARAQLAALAAVLLVEGPRRKAASGWATRAPRKR